MKINVIVKWVIYKITNPNGRIYIGKTSRFKLRISSYRCLDCKDQIILFASLKKYGFENHKIKIIEEFVGSNEYANEREIFWINHYKTNVYLYGKYCGMNMTNGGDGVSGRKLSEEAKKRIGEAAKGRVPWNKGVPQTEEQKAIHSIKMKGRVSPMKGKKQSEEARRKLSEYLTGRPSKFKGVKNRMSPEGKQRMIAANTGRTSWNKGKKSSPETIQKLRDSHKGLPGNRAIPIEQYSLKGVFIKDFPSVKIAADELGITSECIFQNLRGKIKYPKLFLFKRKIAA